MTLQSYRDLKVWQKAMDLVAESYEISGMLPKHELFGLISQIRRAAVSIPANIAEGYGRQHRREYLNFLSMAAGSLKELETHLLIAIRLKYVAESQLSTALTFSDEVGRMLTALTRTLRSSAAHADRDLT